LENTRNINTLNASSALPKSNCNTFYEEEVELIFCNVYQIPYRVFAFLFRPLLLFDQGSLIQNYAAVENLAWMILISISLTQSMKRNQSFPAKAINISLVCYILIFVSSASLYDGNLGTAFRHKSTILWPAIFILMISPKQILNFKRSKYSN